MTLQDIEAELKSSPAGPILHAYLTGKIMEVEQKIIHDLNGDNTHRLQGARLAYTALLKSISRPE